MTDRSNEESAQDRAPTPDPATPAVNPPEAVAIVVPQVTRAAPTRVGPGMRAPGSTPAAPAAVAPARIPEPAPAAPRRRRLPLILGSLVAVAAVVLAAGAAVLLVNRVTTADSAESHVTTAITDFVRALDRGDLAALRAGTCGELGDYYRQVPDAEFADVYRAANSDRAVPVLDSVGAITVTENTALAQVTVHPAKAPNSSSVRSFQLELQDGVWKVCS